MKTVVNSGMDSTADVTFFDCTPCVSRGLHLSRAENGDEPDLIPCHSSFAQLPATHYLAKAAEDHLDDVISWNQ